MPASVIVNEPETVVHRRSGGLSQSQVDVCKTPTPGGPTPVPYPNIASSRHTANGTRSVRCDGQSVMAKGSYFSTSTGDEPGTLGGVKSGSTRGRADPMLYSFDVKFEGRNVVRRSDPMLQNKKNCF